MKLISTSVYAPAMRLTLYFTAGIVALTSSRELSLLLDYVVTGIVETQDMSILAFSIGIEHMLFALPIALFLAVYITLRRAFNNMEAFVWMASGYSMWRITQDACRVSCIIAIWMVVLHFWVAPAVTFAAKNIITERTYSLSVEKILHQPVYTLGDVRIEAAALAGKNTLADVLVYRETHIANEQELITAQKMELVSHAQDDSVYLYFTDGVLYKLSTDAATPLERMQFAELYINPGRNNTINAIHTAKTLQIQDLLTQTKTEYIQQLYLRIASVLFVFANTLIACACGYTSPRRSNMMQLVVGIAVVTAYIGTTTMIIEKFVTTHVTGLLVYSIHCAVAIGALVYIHGNSHAVSPYFWRAWRKCKYNES